MRIFERNKPCEDCAKTRAALADLEDRMDREELRYRELYEIARRNLAKMAQRAKSDEPEDDMAYARKILAERKLKKEA